MKSLLQNAVKNYLNPELSTKMADTKMKNDQCLHLLWQNEQTKNEWRALWHWITHTKIQSIACIWEAPWDSWVRGESGGARRWKSIRESQSLWGALEPPLAASWDYHPGKPHKRPALFSVSCTWAPLELLLHLESIMEQHMGPSRTPVSLACGTAERHRKRKIGE